MGGERKKDPRLDKKKVLLPEKSLRKLKDSRLAKASAVPSVNLSTPLHLLSRRPSALEPTLQCATLVGQKANRQAKLELRELQASRIDELVPMERTVVHVDQSADQLQQRQLSGSTACTSCLGQAQYSLAEVKQQTGEFLKSSQDRLTACLDKLSHARAERNKLQVWLFLYVCGSISACCF